MVVELKNVAEFDSLVIQGSADNQLVVVDFSAEWCPPCKMIAPKYEALSKKETSVKFYKVDVDVADDVSQKAGISCMPTFKFYKNGECVETLEGASEDKLKALVAKHK
ncbi:thioredoxin 1-like [Bolinopsis microptera]|uniref:thioredoxin 1-like n=1 Tax=Bolinopsis microptera TaxID=2820187 RepID=UPI003078EAA8